MNEPVIHRKKRIQVFNDRKVAAFVAPASKPAKVKKPKPEKVKKVKTPPPPPRVRGPAPVPHPDGTREQRIQLFLNLLREENEVFQRGVPLKIKIHKDIIAKYPHIAKHVIRGALHEHCKDVAYLRSLVSGASRFDLAMQVVDVVTDDQQVEAKSRVRLRMATLIKPR
jgi:hypothetical protein